MSGTTPHCLVYELARGVVREERERKRGTER
jgi:hypothetical protein